MNSQVVYFSSDAYVHNYHLQGNNVEQGGEKNHSRLKIGVGERQTQLSNTGGVKWKLP